MQPDPQSDPQAIHDLASVHTHSLTHLLKQLGISLAISTYQAGKLILARAEGDVTNTHFRVFNKPMGLASDGQRIALGTAAQIWEFHNVPASASRLPPANMHDACYVPRAMQVTGDVDIHEMAWAGDELWFINTRFSCLCTLDKRYSFVPRWRPPFISAYDMRDRCHLNGLGMRDGKPRYITALGTADEPGGWRKTKADGGVLMDLQGDRFILRGLSMPHSPRWYRDRLWLLESGRGALSQVDPESGELTCVAELPGFTRGLDFIGDFAFIGLSQVRETAVFAGLPLTRSQPVRHSGVWVVDIRNGETVAFLRFEKGVQEIFAVTVLPHRFPDLLTDDPHMLGSTYVLPDETLAETVQPSPNWEFAESHFEAGNQHYNEGRAQEAVACYEKALKLHPDYLPARFNLGVALGNLERFDAAMVELEKVIADEAGHTEAYNSLGYVYGRLGNNEQAVNAFEKAVAIRPDFAQAHYNLGLNLLLLGQYRRGWAECEWRWRTDQVQGLATERPRWDGSAIPDKSLLIHTEQGAGDAIQFARFVPLAAERCGRLILVCPHNLAPIFSRLPGVAECRGPGTIPKQSFDSHVSLMSLPHLLDIGLDNLPNAMPYLNAPERPRHQLPAAGKGRLKVGIVWAGNPDQANDRHRSTQLEQWQPLLGQTGVNFFSLQVGECAKELSLLPEDISIADLSGRIVDYADTAAFITQLDLVIAVDTSVAHLAGALNTPVWVLLSHAADWRYLLGREDSPWYPGMRLFRQRRQGQWGTVFEEVQKALQSIRCN